MEYKFKIDKANNLLIESWQGRITKKDLMSGAEESFKNEDYKRDLKAICDFRDAQIEMTSSEMRQFVQWISGAEKFEKLAIVVEKKSEFGMARMFEILSEDKRCFEELRIFKNFDEARKWVLNDGRDN